MSASKVYGLPQPRSSQYDAFQHQSFQSQGQQQNSQRDSLNASQSHSQFGGSYEGLTSRRTMAQALPPFQIPARQFSGQQSNTLANNTLSNSGFQSQSYGSANDYDAYSEPQSTQTQTQTNFTQHWPSNVQQQTSSTRHQQQPSQSFDSSYGRQQVAQTQTNRNLFSSYPEAKQSTQRLQTQRLEPSPRASMKDADSYSQTYQNQYAAQEPASTLAQSSYGSNLNGYGNYNLTNTVVSQNQQSGQYPSYGSNVQYGQTVPSQSLASLPQYSARQEAHQRAPSLDLRNYGAYGVPSTQPGYGSYNSSLSGHSFGQSPYAISRSIRPPQPGSERPFKCDQCPQSFQRSHDLKRHKRIHLAVKPFPCPSCDKSFSRKDALKRHILVKGLPGHGASVLNEYNQQQQSQPLHHR